MAREWEMVISSDSKVVRSNRVSMVIDPGLYVSPRDGIAGSSEAWGKYPGVAVAAFSAPGPGPQEMQPFLVWM